jgi:hypothetical protein
MSAIFSACALFYVLCFVATTVALAADSVPSTSLRSERVALSVADSMTDDERILTTIAAPTVPASAAKPASKVAHAA